MRVPELLEFCETHSLVLTSIADMIEYVQELQAAGELEALGWSTKELQAAELVQSMQQAAGLEKNGSSPAGAAAA